jgi:hypothetical protein
MNEKLANMSQIVRKFVEQQIDVALTRNGLSYTSPVRAELEGEVALLGDRDPIVRICDSNGRILTLDARINALRDDPRFSSSFPSSPKLRIVRNNQEKIRRNFEAVARGDAIVG